MDIFFMLAQKEKSPDAKVILISSMVSKAVASCVSYPHEVGQAIHLKKGTFGLGL